MQIILFLLAVLLWPGTVTAQTDLYPLFPDKEVVGWTRVEDPQQYRGDELFMMIDGGADIYHEYGFSQVVAGEYENAEGKFIRLEIYEMTSPQAAYGIYSFKTSADGKTLDIGQAALLEEYYLNIWKGNLLVTIVGSDAETATTDAVIAFGRFIDRHYSEQGSVPELAQLLLSQPVAFSNPKYVLGSIGAMNSYVFDTEDIFTVREGMVGTVKGNKAFVFRYTDSDESTQIFHNVTTRFETGQRFHETAVHDNLCSMLSRDNHFIVVVRSDQDIVIVIGENQQDILALADQLVMKLKGA